MVLRWAGKGTPGAARNLAPGEAPECKTLCNPGWKPQKRLAGESAGFGISRGGVLPERDGETGLDYFMARHYGAGLGRFIQVDPANAGAYLRRDAVRLLPVW